MAIKDDRIDLIDSWANVTTGNLRDNNNKIITPAFARQATTDLYDTVLTSEQTVADVTALNALSLGTDFKQSDIAFVTDIAKGDKIGVYFYIRNRGTGNFSWVKINELGESTKLITSAEATLALYISNDWTVGDLAIGYLVKISTSQIYILVTGTGSSTGNYQLIFEPSGVNLVPVADISARDGLSPGINDIVTVNDNGNLEKVKYKWMYDNDSSGYAWVEIGLLSNVGFG